MAEEKKQGFVEHITPRDVDFSQWYTDVILKSQLVDYAPRVQPVRIRPGPGRVLPERMSGSKQPHHRRSALRAGAADD